MTIRNRPGIAAARALGDPRAVPDLRWIARLSGRSEAEINGYLGELDRLLPTEGKIRETLRDGGRDFYAQFRAPLDLYAIVRSLRPSNVLETGVSSGVSSAHILLALRANRSGRLTSIDLPTFQKAEQLGRGESVVSIPPGRRSGWAIPAELREGWDLRIGPAQRLLPKALKELGPIDLFLHDDLHTPKHLAEELDLLEPRLRAGSVVLADNTQWTGRSFDRFAARKAVRVRRRRGTDLVGVRLP